MIFYFTGTGNSLYAAKKLALEGEKLINMATARKQKKFVFERGSEERVGFVFPEYCAAVPEPVLEFVKRLKLIGEGYTFAVVTLGGNKSFSGVMLRDKLAERGIPLDYSEHVMMPNNCVTLTDVPDKTEVERMIKAADRELAHIKKLLNAKKSFPIKNNLTAKLCYPVYRLMATTKPFSVEDSCVGCGMCAKNCPDQAIRMKDGKPVWVKPSCALCVGCINRCPVRAIQYGKRTKARRRYVNQIMNKV